MEFNGKTANQVSAGAFDFIYLSPDVFLNSPLFRDVFYDNKFQDWLTLIVIEKAHMVYLWGLVDSGKAKNSSAHKRTQDCSLFQPLYGNIGGQLNATEAVPILLLSATCRPVAIKGILKCLFITEDSINFAQGELTRPKIGILQVVMKCSLKSNYDLLRVIEKVETVEKDIAPTLIFAGTRNATLQVMKVVNQSWKTPTAKRNPCSSMMHQYHFNTGVYAKVNFSLPTRNILTLHVKWLLVWARTGNKCARSFTWAAPIL
jgi:superfamily II DNA helicase RecQ